MLGIQEPVDKLLVRLVTRVSDESFDDLYRNLSTWANPRLVRS